MAKREVDLGNAVGPKGDTGVSLRFAGAWDSSSQYTNNSAYIDLVEHEGSLWASLRNSQGETPGEGSAYWALAARGIPEETLAGLKEVYVQASQPENPKAGSIWIQ